MQTLRLHKYLRPSFSQFLHHPRPEIRACAVLPGSSILSPFWINSGLLPGLSKQLSSYILHYHILNSLFYVLRRKTLSKSSTSSSGEYCLLLVSTVSYRFILTFRDGNNDAAKSTISPARL